MAAQLEATLSLIQNKVLETKLVVVVFIYHQNTKCGFDEPVRHIWTEMYTRHYSHDKLYKVQWKASTDETVNYDKCDNHSLSLAFGLSRCHVRSSFTVHVYTHNVPIHSTKMFLFIKRCQVMKLWPDGEGETGMVELNDPLALIVQSFLIRYNCMQHLNGCGHVNFKLAITS